MRRGRGGDADGGLVDVRLDDTAEAEADALARDGAGARRPSATRRRWMAVATVVLASAGALGAWRAGSDAPRPPLPTGVVGATASLDEPLHEIWRAGAVGQLLAVDHQVVAVTGPSGDPAAQVYDAVTGDLLWERPTGAGELCAPSSAEGGRTLLCYVPWIPAQDATAPGEPAEVVALDLRTGTELGRPEIQTRLLDAEALDSGEWLLTWADVAAAVHVGRWVPGAGMSWVVDAAPDALVRLGVDGWLVHVDGDSFWLGGAGNPERDLVTGAVLSGGTPASGSMPLVTSTPLPDGGRLDDVVEDGSERTEAFGASGALLFSLEGRPFEPAVSDGTPPGVLLVRAGGGLGGVSGDVAGVDATTGAELWRTHVVGQPEPVVRAAGTLLVTGSGRVIALDVATGTVRWDSATSGWAALPVSDGRTVLVRAQAPDGAELVAVDIGSGETRWRTPVPSADVRSAVALDGRRAALLFQDGTLSVLG